MDPNHNQGWHHGDRNRHGNSGRGGGWGSSSHHYRGGGGRNQHQHHQHQHQHHHHHRGHDDNNHYGRGGGGGYNDQSNHYYGSAHHDERTGTTGGGWNDERMDMDTHNNSKRPAAEAVSFAAPTMAPSSNTSTSATTTFFGFDANIAPQKKSKTAAIDDPFPMEAALPPTEEGTIEDLFATACTMSDAPAEEISNKDAFLACLREIDRSLDGVSQQAHQLPKGWDETKQSAVQKTLQELAKIPRASMNYDDDDEESEDSDPFGRTTISAPTVGLSLDEKKFIEALPFCIPLDSGFHVVRPNASGICYCPCGPNLKPWRDRFNLHHHNNCTHKRFTPNALMDHLKEAGGCYEAKSQGRMSTVPLQDMCHHATKIYLQHLYGDWFGKGFAHKALHPPLSTNHQRAVNEELRRIEREVVVGKRQLRKVEEEQEKLQVELKKKEKELSLLDEDRRETMKRLDELRERFQVERRDKLALSDHQLTKFEAMTSNYFALKKLQVGTLEDDVVKFEVKHEVGDSVGFSLQNFFDENFVNAHSVLFEDETDDQSIARAVLATWDIIYDAKGDYEQSEASKEEGTAVDQGGPSRQFLSDVFKQIDMLSVKVRNESVNIFENTPSGVVVLTDELLNNNINVAAKRSGAKAKEKVAAIKRAKAYVRAVGRIIIHSMANKYILPAKALPPFFMTVMFHGYDETYHRDDILHHVGKNINDELLDSDGNELTTEAFFDEFIPDFFIRSRKMLLGSLQDGLTIGSPDTSTNDRLVMGCGIAREMFFNVPLEAIQKIYFSKSNLSVEDLLEVIVPIYGGPDHPDMRLTKKDKADLIQKQKIFFNGDFKRYLRESAEEDGNFIVKFVECVTGSNYLPYDGERQIQLEFSFQKLEGLPHFHSCTRDIVIPGYDYYWSDYKEFKDVKMNNTIDMVFNQFTMQ